MPDSSPYCPDWSWWMRSGERYCLGLDLMHVLKENRHQASASVGRGLRVAWQRIGQGEPVVLALRGSGMRLPIEAWCLLEAGEHSGRLGEAMKEVGEQLRQSGIRRRALLGQLWYPLVVLTAGAVVMAVILLWVVPEMRAICASMHRGAQLPWLTEHIGYLYGGAFLSVLSGCALAGTLLALLRPASRRSLEWARRQEFLMRAIPLWGWLRARRRQARLLRQLATLLGSGVTLAQALRSSADGSPDAWEREEVLAFRERLLLGGGFPAAMEHFPLIDAEQSALLLAGQESGRLETYMSQLAEDLEATVAWRLEQWTRALEPLTILGLAVAVGGLVMAYLLPMVHMLEQLA